MATPTVIVARRVRPGAERDFQRWNDRLRAAAARSPGHLGSEVQPPGEAHPEEWVTVYRFDTPEHLEAWLASPRRAALLAEGEALVDGPAREQRVVEPAAGTAPVTAVLSQRLRPDADAAFRRFHVESSLVMADFPGFIRSDLVEPVPGVQDEHVLILSFDSKAALDRWLASEERRSMLADLEPLLAGERTLNVVGGFGGWFPATDRRQPRRWKQALVVLLALFPTALVLSALQRWLLPGIPWPLGVLLGNVLGIAVLTWLLMPWLTALLAGWLRR